MFITAVAFDIIAQWTKRSGLADTAYYNLLVAAISTLPVLATGIVAWQFQLDGQKLKGILFLHLVLACFSSVMICLVWWVHFRARRRPEVQPPGGSSARLLRAAARGNAPTRPGRSSRLRNTQVPGAGTGCP